MNTEVLTALGVIAALIAAFAQLRQLRLTEQQLKREVATLSDVVQRLEAERKSRLLGEEQLKTETERLRKEARAQDDIVTKIGFVGQLHEVQLLHRVAVGLSLVIAHCRGAAPSTNQLLRTRLNELDEMVNAQAKAVSALADRIQQVADGKTHEQSHFGNAYKEATIAWQLFFEKVRKH